MFFTTALERNVRLAYQVVWTVVISLGMASPGLAGELGNLKSSVDQLVGPLIDSGRVVGLVVGLHREGQSTVWGYGKSGPGFRQTPDGRTLFEIGSITKVFTALALADLAEGLVRLDDPVSGYLPATVRVPTRRPPDHVARSGDAPPAFRDCLRISLVTSPSIRRIRTPPIRSSSSTKRFPTSLATTPGNISPTATSEWVFWAMSLSAASRGRL